MSTSSLQSDELPELPLEIWRDIGRRSRSRLDITRFRSFCRTWRSALPPPTLFPLQVPSPPGPSTNPNSVSCFISEITFYAVKTRGRYISTLPKIVAFEEEHTGGKFTASIFLDKNQIHRTALWLPPVNELSEFVFLSNAFHLHNSIPKDQKQKSNYSHNCDVLKIVIISSDCSTYNPNYSRPCDLKVVAHLYDRRLAVLSLGGGGAMKNKWITNISRNSAFEDIINYKGRLYAVDKLGAAFVMDYGSLKMTKVAPALPKFYPFPIPGKRKKMHLAEEEGDLYMLSHDLQALPHYFLETVYRLSLSPGLWIGIGDHLSHSDVFVLDTRSNFAVPREFVYRHSHKNTLPRITIPFICAWPDFTFIRITVGFRDTSGSDRIKCPRQCDRPDLPYV